MVLMYLTAISMLSIALTDELEMLGAQFGPFI
jgi:hypothetical protein